MSGEINKELSITELDAQKLLEQQELARQAAEKRWGGDGINSSSISGNKQVHSTEEMQAALDRTIGAGREHLAALITLADGSFIEVTSGQHVQWVAEQIQGPAKKTILADRLLTDLEKVLIDTLAAQRRINNLANTTIQSLMNGNVGK